MKINIKKQSNILNVSSDPAELLEATSDGNFLYSIRFLVDIEKALKNRSYYVKTSVYQESPVNPELDGFGKKNSIEIINDLLNRKAQENQLVKNKKKKELFSIVTDITKKIPNDKIKEILNNPNSFKKTSLVLSKAETTSKVGSTKPLFVQNTNSNNLGVSNDDLPQELGNDLLLSYGIDPASVADKNYALNGPRRVFLGVSLNETGKGSITGLLSSQGPNVILGSLLSNLVENGSNHNDQGSLSSQSKFHMIFEEFTRFLEFKETIKIPISFVGTDFFLLFQLEDSQGVEQDRVVVLVQHSKKVSAMKIPILPPMFLGVNTQSGPRFEVSQKDKNGIGILVYRRVVGLYDSEEKADYVQIAKIPLRYGEGSKFLQDDYVGGKTVIYRAITYNIYETKGSDFSSVVIKPTKLGYQKTKNKTYLSLVAKIVNKEIHLELSNIPEKVLFLQVHKRDLSRKDRIEDRTPVGKGIYMPQSTTKDTKFFLADDQVVTGRVYEYSVSLTFWDGSSSWATSTKEILFKPIETNTVSTKLDNIKFLTNGQETDVTFSIKTEIQDEKIISLKKSMENQGILGFFQDDLTANREKIQKLIGYGITRTNINSGETEDFGIFQGSVFSDRENGKKVGVREPIFGNSYEYNVVTFLRRAETMVDTFISSVSGSSGRSYDYYPARWKHPVTLKEGNLIDQFSLNRNHPETDYSFGDIGSIEQIRIKIKEDSPTSDKANATQLATGKALVRWSVQDPNNEIDHFLVIREEMGIKTLIGKTHSKDDNISFVDLLSENLSGNQSYKIMERAVTYFIIPVFYNYSYGTTMKTEELIVKVAD